MQCEGGEQSTVTVELSGRSPAVLFRWAELSKVLLYVKCIPALTLPYPLSFSQPFQRGFFSSHSDHGRGCYSVGGTDQFIGKIPIPPTQ